MDFVAIDFETANRNWNSACEIGLVVVEDGRVVDTYRRLIRPTPNRFDAGNIRVHRIRPEQVVSEPTFAELYEELLPYLADRHLVAHNASFDMGVLLATAKLYGLPKPSLTYSCTVQLARRVWPEAPRYGLGVISAYLGIELDHHRALSDANACAEIMLHAQHRYGSAQVEDLLAEVGLKPRSIDQYGASGRSRGSKWSWQPHSGAGAAFAKTHPAAPKPRTRVHNWPSHPRIKDIAFDGSRADARHPAYGKRFAFTGELEGSTREAAMRRVLEAGGKCTASVTNATNYLVRGVPTWGRVTAKVRKAEALAAAGRALRIIGEQEFEALFERQLVADPREGHAPLRT